MYGFLLAVEYNVVVFSGGVELPDDQEFPEGAAFVRRWETYAKMALVQPDTPPLNQSPYTWDTWSEKVCNRGPPLVLELHLCDDVKCVLEGRAAGVADALCHRWPPYVV